MIGSGRKCISKWKKIRGALLSAGVMLAGCESATPTRRELGATNKLVIDRTGHDFNSAKLLSYDLSRQEPAPVGVLTLEEAVTRTLHHNYALVAAAETLTIARAQVAQASLIQNPTLGQSSGLLYPLSPAMGLPSFDFNITQALNSIFTQPSRVRVARLQEVQTRIDLANQAFTLAQQAQSKYQEMTHLVRSRRIAQRVVRVYGRAVEAAEARQQVGLIPQPELNRARLNYTDAVRQERHLGLQYQRAAQEMNWLMGIASPPQWKVPEDELAPPARLPPPPPGRVLERLGLKYRLDLLRADYDRKLGAFGVKLARIGLFPPITVGAEFARDSGKHWAGGPVLVGVGVPIFDPGVVGLTLAEDQHRKADKTYLSVEGQVHQDVRTAVANYQIAEDDLIFFREKLIPQQEQNGRLMQESFRLGNDDLDALLNTVHDYVTALQSYEDTTQAYQDSSVALQTAVGLVWEQIRRQTGAPANPSPTTVSTQPQTQYQP
ncbi:MAG TPA: TolC family protein [Tepidisphaeraceae bacterium]|nr:TolC family protein [Tepidisphaeraceae bacterium]